MYIPFLVLCGSIIIIKKNPKTKPKPSLLSEKRRWGKKFSHHLLTHLELLAVLFMLDYFVWNKFCALCQTKDRNFFLPQKIDSFIQVRLPRDKNLCPNVELIQRNKGPPPFAGLHRHREILLKGFPPPTAHFLSAPHSGDTFLTPCTSSSPLGSCSTKQQPTPRQQRNPPCYLLRGSNKELAVPTSGSHQLHQEGKGGIIPPLTCWN